MEWTTPADLKAQLQRYWDDGRLLSAALAGEPLFPLTLRLRKPDARAMAERFDEVRGWIRGLEEGSRARQSFGYDIEWEEIRHRQLGRNNVPVKVLVPGEDDALRMIGRTRQAADFRRFAEMTFAAFPALREWVLRRPLAVVEHTDEWERILATLAWFREHPRSGLYLRQLDIPGVDTKFIEARKGLLAELLDTILAPGAVEPDFRGAKGFEQRYGLLPKPSLIRFRLLDARLHLAGLSDLTVPVAQFAGLDLPVRRVFITENDVNGLAFPEVAESAVIFGKGYDLNRLGEIGWLGDKAVFYWGDIDTHGFAILDRLRAACPGARSLLMDRETLLAHKALWVQEPEDTRYCSDLTRLTAEEQSVFDCLRFDRPGERVRLEQERIGFGWFELALRDAVTRS